MRCRSRVECSLMASQHCPHAAWPPSNLKKAFGQNPTHVMLCFKAHEGHVHPPGSAFMGCFLIFLTRVSLGSKPASLAPYVAQLGVGSM